MVVLIAPVVWSAGAASKAPGLSSV